ncbi:MAG TPA: hypothetical protein VFL91_20895 [Thermomicrobiales bacterium]|nr:hypothetical protein [Thermomicrobiales bacterium]
MSKLEISLHNYFVTLVKYDVRNPDAERRVYPVTSTSSEKRR